MRKLLFWVLLISSAVAQQVNQDIVPATTGLNLGHTNQRWNAYINNLNITGSCTLNGQPCFGGGGGGGGGNTHPALPFTSVQFNNSGTFGGSASFTFNPLTSSLSLIGTLSVSGNAVITGTLTNTSLGVGGPFCLQETNGIISSTGVACGGGGGGGGLTGSGTANRIAMWTGPTALGNSSITDNGTTLVSTGETLTLTGTAVNNVAGQALIVNQNTTNIGTGCSNFNIDITHPNPLQCVSSQFGFTPGSTSNITSAFAVWGTLGPPGKNVTNVEVAGAFTIGSTSNTIAEARAVHAAVNASAGTVNTATGVFAETFNNNIGASNFTTARALYAINVYGGVGGTGATNSYGLYVDSPNINGVSTISHQYGVFIADQSPNGLGLNSDPWGIFEAGTAKNQLGGSLTLAGISGSVQCLHVNAAGLITGTGVDCGSGGTLPSGTGVLTIVAGAYGAVLSETGTGNAVLSNSPTLVTPNLGTPSTLVLTNATGAPTWNQNTSGTSANLLGCTPSTAGDVCIWTGSAWLKFAGNTSGTASLQENASGVPSWGSGSATTFQVNTVALSSATTVNFLNSAATNGQTFTFTNTSAGNIQLGVTGTLNNAGLTNSSVTINGANPSLGGTANISFQHNGTPNTTLTTGLNFVNSLSDSVGLTATVSNPASNQWRVEITGGSYTGNAAGLFGTPSITVNAVTATQINGTTWTGTWAGAPLITGNLTFSGNPIYSALISAATQCVQATASGVLQGTGSACGSGGGGSISGTANYVAAFNAGGTGLVSVGSLVSGQLVVIQNGAAPIASSPSLLDSGSAPVNTTPYTIQCDSATTMLDRSTTLPFTTGANIVTVPLSSASGCGGLAVIVEAQTSITLGPTGADTFTVYGAGGAVLTGQTTLAMSSGQTASLNQSSSGTWTIRFAEGGSVYNVTSGSGLTGGPCTGTCTLSIAAGGVTNAMLAGSIAITKLAAQTQNTVLGSFTGTAVQPLPMTTCSANNDAVQYTTNTGFNCYTKIGMLDVASTWTTNQTLTGHLIVSGHDVAIPLTCANTTASGSAQVCNTTPPFTPVANDCVNFTTNTANTGTGLTINVNSLGAKSIAKWQTSTTLAANDVRANTATTLCYDGTNWELDTIGNGPTGTGTVTVVSSGSLTSTALVTGGGSQTLQTICSGCTLTSTDMVLSATLSVSALGTFSAAGASSTPGLTVTGAPATAFGTTANFPQFYMNCATSTGPSSFSGNGTYMGVNACSPFTGNFIDFHLNGGASLFSVGNSGAITMGVGTTSIGSTASGNPRISFSATSISANQPFSIVQATNQLVLGTSPNFTTLNFPASSGAQIVTMPNVTTTVAALDVANTWNALQTFGSNISIGGTTATGATGTGSVVFATSPTVTGLSSDAITCGVASTTACVITGNGSTSGTATLTWPAVSGTATNPITSSNRISAPEFTSTVATGTAPLVVSSTTKVTNLNSDTTDGIGLGTPVAGGIGYGVTTTQIGTTAAGTAGQVVISGGTSAPTMIDFPERLFIPAANCNTTTAGAGWSIGSGGTVACRAGTNNLGGAIQITDTAATFAQFTLMIPLDWDSATRPYIRFYVSSASDTTNGHTIKPQVKVSCPTAAGGTVSDDATFSAAQTLANFVTLGASAVANGFYNGANDQIGATQMTGCIAGGMMIVQVGRATDTATGNINFWGADVTFPRLIAVQAN